MASLAKLPVEVVVHPIVLLSVVDHFDRVAKGTSKRIIGTLLGEMRDDKLHIMSSFAVPFEEEARDPSVWFVDHNYHEELSYMCNKVNAKEVVVGWYSSGPKIKPADLQIHEIYRKYCDEPVFVILDVVGKNKDLSLIATQTTSDILECYISVKEPTYEEAFSRTFKSLPATFGADEAEEVGTEHLLRDIRNRSTSTLANRVHQKCESQRTLIGKLEEIKSYLSMVRSGKYPYNTQIIEVLQEIFNELPESVQNVTDEDKDDCTGLKRSNSHASGHGGSPLERTNSSAHTSEAGREAESLSNPEAAKWISNEANDQYLGLYVGSMLRSIITLHNLVNNKIAARDFVLDLEKEKNEKKNGEKGKEGTVK